MADVFVERSPHPNRDGAPMVSIAIEPNPKARDGTTLAFSTKHGFGFIMRLQDAIGMAAAIDSLAVKLHRRPKRVVDTQDRPKVKAASKKGGEYILSGRRRRE